MKEENLTDHTLYDSDYKAFYKRKNYKVIKKKNQWLPRVTEKAVATHSSVLAWRMPGTGEPGGLPSMGSHRVGHD